MLRERKLGYYPQICVSPKPAVDVSWVAKSAKKGRESSRPSLILFESVEFSSARAAFPSALAEELAKQTELLLRTAAAVSGRAGDVFGIAVGTGEGAARKIRAGSRAHPDDIAAARAGLGGVRHRARTLRTL